MIHSAMDSKPIETIEFTHKKVASHLKKALEEKTYIYPSQLLSDDNQTVLVNQNRSWHLQSLRQHVICEQDIIPNDTDKFNNFAVYEMKIEWKEEKNATAFIAF